MSEFDHKLPGRWPKLSLSSYLIALVAMALVISSFNSSGFNDNLDFARIWGSIKLFLTEMFPPDLSRLSQILSALWQTIQMAVAGTTLGVMCSLPLAFLAAKNTSPARPVFYLARLFISVFRTIPDLIWALFFVITIGLGPLAGTLALMIDTIGFCGKFFAESVEEADPKPTTGLTALGAGRVSTIICAILPEVMPSFINTILFSLEKAVRSSVVLGLVGAGGIGIELKVSMETFRYDQAATIIIVIFLMVLIVERLSSQIRNKLLA